MDQGPLPLWTVTRETHLASGTNAPLGFLAVKWPHHPNIFHRQTSCAHSQGAVGGFRDKVPRRILSTLSEDLKACTHLLRVWMFLELANSFILFPPWNIPKMIMEGKSWGAACLWLFSPPQPFLAGLQ